MTTEVRPAVALERAQLSMGMADMDGFMAAVEGRSEEEVAALLQETYEAIGDAIVGNGGRIWKYLGDAVLFSCPSPAGAARAAQEIAALRFRSGEKEVRFHVSVATGPVVIGRFGHSSFENDDVFGHTIHRAAVMGKDAKADPSHVALDEATKRAIG